MRNRTVALPPTSWARAYPTVRTFVRRAADDPPSIPRSPLCWGRSRRRRARPFQGSCRRPVRMNEFFRILVRKRSKSGANPFAILTPRLLGYWAATTVPTVYRGSRSRSSVRHVVAAAPSIVIGLFIIGFFYGVFLTLSPTP